MLKKTRIFFLLLTVLLVSAAQFVSAQDSETDLTWTEIYEYPRNGVEWSILISEPIPAAMLGGGDGLARVPLFSAFSFCKKLYARLPNSFEAKLLSIGESEWVTSEVQSLWLGYRSTNLRNPQFRWEDPSGSKPVFRCVRNRQKPYKILDR